MTQRAALVLFAGTSFSVGVTDLVLSRARIRRVPVFSIDPAAHNPPPHVQVIPSPAEIALAALATSVSD